MKTKKILVLTAAMLTMVCTSANVYADTLTERDGLKYLISDSGEDKGLYNGWTKKGDDYYYYKNGERKKNCWLTSNGVRKYFLKADGTRATGKVTIQGVEYEFDEKGVIIPEEWGLTFTAKDLTPTGCTVVFTQSGGNSIAELSTGSTFIIEQYKNGEWKEAEWLPGAEDIAFSGVGIVLPTDDSRELMCIWDDIYGELSAGKYRIGKEVSNYNRPGGHDDKMYYAYFEI